MTAKTTKDETDEVAAVPAEEDAAAEETEDAAEAAETETEQEARPARPAAKRKRRVRVIEVIDDDDLDEVLEALDAEDAEDETAEEEPPARPARPARPAKAAKTTPAAKPTKTAKPVTTVKPRPAVEPPEDEAEEKKPAAAERAVRPTLFGLGMVQAVVVVVLVALLASLAIWQWRSASSLSSEKDDRAAVSEVAAAYGDVAFNYNAQNYQTQADKAQKLMAGDLLDEFKKTTLPSLTNAFQADPKVALSSKTNQVFVGSLDGRFATAVVMVDVSLKTKDGQATEPATLLRLSLSKVDGDWKVTQQYPSGINEQNEGQQGNLPTTVPGGGASESPKAENSEKPKN